MSKSSCDLYPIIRRGGSLPYSDKLIAVAPSNLIAYWKLNEESGTTANDSSGNARHGTISGATLGQPGIGDGLTSMLFDGVNDVIDVFSDGLASAFDWQSGTLFFWLKPLNTGVWSDGANRRIVRVSDGTNSLKLQKESTDGRIIFYIGANAISITDGITSDWRMCAMTWNVAQNQEIAYHRNATASGICQNPGASTPTIFVIGANDTGGGAGWAGCLQHVAFWNTPLSAAQIASLAVV